MKRKNWTKKETEDLLKIYSNTSIKDICIKFNLNKQQINNRIKYLRKTGCKIMKNKSYKITNSFYWTKKNNDLLRKLYKKESMKNICKILKRSKKSIYSHAFKLGLKNRIRDKYTKKSHKVNFKLLLRTPYFLSDISKKYNLCEKYLKKNLVEYRIKNDIFVYRIKKNNILLDMLFCENDEENRLKAYKMIKEKYSKHFKTLSRTKIRMIFGKYLKNYKFKNGKYIFE